MLPEPTARLRFRPMGMADLDEMTAVLSAPDPVHVNRPVRTREDAVRWIEWQQRNYTEHHSGIEHLVALIRPENTPSQAVARALGMVVERTAYVHGGDALVFTMVLRRVS